MSADSQTANARSWRAALLLYTQPATLRMALLGFAAGLPYLLLFGTLSFWLREAGIDKSTIGHLSWVGLMFAFKWVWAPLVDKMRLPLLGRLFGQRRSWLLLAQVVVIGALIGMALNDPKLNLNITVWFALTLALAAATQDIALDAFRIESAPSSEQAALAATYQGGYRLAMIWAGAGALWLAAGAQDPQVSAYDPSAWRWAYLVMAASMGVGLVTVFLSQEPVANKREQADAHYQALLLAVSERGVPIAGIAAFGLWALAVLFMVANAAKLEWMLQLSAVLHYPVAAVVLLALLASVLALKGQALPRYAPAAGSRGQRALAWTQASFIAPFADFLRRYGWHALLILALIAVYRISDIVMGVMANPFYVDMQFTKTEVATVTKFYGVIMTLAGAFIGGVLTLRFGVLRILMLGAVMSAATNLLFAWLYGHGHDVSALIAVVSADNLSSGIASAAFIAYLSGLTSTQYTATQYALFSSMMVLLPKTLGGFSGEYVDHFGWENFFIATALLGIPVLVLIVLAERSQRMLAAANKNTTD